MSNERERSELCINTLRFLAADAIQEAKSGHPGLPLGAAPMAYALWMNHVKANPRDPDWPDRDRFVLSAGHGSALLYALLHLTGHGLPLEELRAFRQWGSRTAGHPESHLTSGVEVTTGPLGQGLANAVGLAIAERHLAETFNRPGHEVVDHYTYVIAGDGDLMEGVCYEACALAGHLGLGKLIVLYDSNDICLAGATELSWTEDVGTRFEAIGWDVRIVEDGNDVASIDAAIEAAKHTPAQPSLIEVKTVIGYGAPTKAGTHRAHGSPLGEEELAGAKEALGWPAEPRFFIPEGAREAFAAIGERGRADHEAWRRRFEGLREEHPKLAAEFTRRTEGRLPEGWGRSLPTFSSDDAMATRKASEAVLQALAARIPELIGGSADLNPSTYTWLKGFGDFQRSAARDDEVLGAVGGGWGAAGRNIHFGVREHAMGAIVNGIAQHGGLIPYSATFLVFSDYMRPAIRLAALSGYPSIFVFTHDSVFVGEDGPTHQPVEQLMSLRLIPGLAVLRPADAGETAQAWGLAVARREGPTALVLTRQSVPPLADADLVAEGVPRGAYTIWESDAEPELILIGTGSEVSLCVECGKALAGDGIRVRVVSMPSVERFLEQPEVYRESVLPSWARARVAVEAGRSLGWERITGSEGAVLGVDRFGASAPGARVYAEFGFTVENLKETAIRALDRARTSG
ncbi:MAG: transketolase [Candidatus Bipolaricaulota bacterium]|nr:MAG: transketolase [Candidatus Bipolaricaulota bacterium]